MRGITLLFVSLGCIACTRSSDDKPSASAPPANTGSGSTAVASRARTEQVTPPVDVTTPPADATKTASGLVYKKLVNNEAGAAIKRNDTVQINYTGWRQTTGETFFTNRARDQPMPLNLTQAAPGFVEAMQLLRKGEKAMLWIPPEIGYKAPPSEGKPETLVYEVEVVDISPAAPIPDDVAKPPAGASALKSGTKYVVIRPGTGKDKARPFDTVTYNYTAWAGDGRMLDTTEARKRAVTAPVYKQAAALEEMLTSMTAGQRVRFWVDAEKMAQGGKPVGGVSQGVLCYELEVLQIAKGAHEPPPPPPDVAKPPEGTKRTAKGVYYRLLKGSGKDQHPTPDDAVKVNYAGWTTDGRMFDSSYIKGDPIQFNLNGTIPGWIDGIPLMALGDRMRFWIPEDMAYKGVAGKPEGMLVFDVELVDIVQKAH
jgi:FKBP-type peptidyl-prolyl cis-trans isomerase